MRLRRSSRAAGPAAAHDSRLGPRDAPRITSAQRDALYDQILDRLSGIGDIEVAIRAENYVDADRIGREYCDDLRLLLDDLGLGDGNSGPVELTSPPEVLRRVLPRLRQLAEGHSVSLQAAFAEEREIENRNRLVAEACTSVLDGLAGGEASPG